MPTHESSVADEIAAFLVGEFGKKRICSAVTATSPPMRWPIGRRGGDGFQPGKGFAFGLDQVRPAMHGIGCVRAGGGWTSGFAERRLGSGYGLVDKAVIGYGALGIERRHRRGGAWATHPGIDVAPADEMAFRKLNVSGSKLRAMAGSWMIGEAHEATIPLNTLVRSS